MWPPMPNPLINPTISPKPVQGIVQAGIVTYCGGPSDEDEDYYERKHKLECHESFLSKNHTMTRREEHHPWLEMLVDHL